MKYFLLFLLAFSLSASVYAQSKEDEAMVLYQKAETAYEAAISQSYNSNQNYHDADNYIDKLVALIGTNPKILYLRIKIFNRGINDKVWSTNENNYKILMGYITDLFSKVDKATYPPEKYSEMVGIKLDVQDKLTAFENARIAQNKHLADMQRREAVFIRDTFDVYMNKLVQSFNTSNTPKFDPNAKYKNKTMLKIAKHFTPHHLEYNALTKQLYVYKTYPEEKKEPFCCKDSIYVFGTVKYFPEAKEGRNWLDSIVFYNPTNKSKPAEKRHLQMLFIYKEDYGFYYIDKKIIEDLTDIMHKTGFDEYFENKKWAWTASK